jgi:oligosaccharide translocation protein RFT1
MATLFAQGFVKHILTQGDTLLIAWLAPLAAQGAYALASNYGGLAARLLFQPIEESSRSYFGKLLNSDSGPVPRTNILTATRDVHRLLRFYFLISLLAMALGPTAAPLLLKIVAGPRWANSGASDALALFAYYVPLLALNGILEAFVSSVASEEEVNNQSLWMLGFSFAFACAAYIMLAVLDLGAQGLVFSNMINMGLRIIWSFMFLRRYMRRHNSAIIIRNVFPSAGTMAAAVAAGSMLYGIQQRDLSILYQILSMVVSALMFLAVL